jgi:membrane protein required for beta-lactamase induction
MNKGIMEQHGRLSEHHSTPPAATIQFAVNLLRSISLARVVCFFLITLFGCLVPIRGVFPLNPDRMF